MKHGIYYAYWEHEWAADYCYYVDKAARLGFDVLEIGLPVSFYQADTARHRITTFPPKIRLL